MRSRLEEHAANRIDRLIDGVRIQIEDMTDEQLDKLVNMLIFEQMDRREDLKIWTELGDEDGN